MNILIGSRAFNFHFGLPSPSLTDWDIISPNKIVHPLVDSFYFNEKTNKDIYDYINSQLNPVINSPFGELIIAPLDVLKVIYSSSLEMKTQKYQDKLDSLKNVEVNPFLNEVLQKRILEIRERIDKHKFFLEDVPRLFKHDDIHSWIVDSPTYKKILKENSFTLGKNESFLNLNLQDKINLISEEIFVFSIERDLIPKVLYNKSCVRFVVKELFNPCNELCPLYYWLDKFSFDSGVKRFPKYISAFIRENKEVVLQSTKENWSSYLENLPESFWRELLS